MKHAWLRLRYESVDFFWVVVPVVTAVFAQQLVPPVIALVPDPLARAIASVAIALVVPVAHWVIVRPARERCAAKVAGAVSVVLDEPLSTPPYVWRRLDTGDIRTLRGIAAGTARGALSDALDGAVRELGQSFGKLRRYFDESTRCVTDVPGLRAPVVEVHDGLGRIVTHLGALAAVQNRLTWGARALPESAPVLAEEREVLAALGDDIRRTVAAADGLERRTDPEGARDRARQRAEELARFQEERRCAHRSTVLAAVRCAEAADGERRAGTNDWAQRRRGIEMVREHFTGATTIHTQNMDKATLEFSRKTLDLLFEAIQGTTEAEAAATKGDAGALGAATTKFGTAIDELPKQLEAFAGDELDSARRELSR